MFGTIRTAGILFACAALTAYAGNPVFDGWYADPQIRLYGETIELAPIALTQLRITLFPWTKEIPR